MTFILHRCSDRYLLQSAETRGFIGLIIVANPGEGGRAFSYDFGTIYMPKEIINFGDFPELIEMPFFAIDYSTFNKELIPKLDPEKDQEVLKLLTSECKVSGYHNNQNKSAQNTLPLLWDYTPANLKGSWKIPIWSLMVNQENCWLGNRDGLIIGFNHQGQIINQHQLPLFVSCLIMNDHHFYASCHDGQIYEISGKIPQTVYHLRPNTYYSDLNIFNINFAQKNIVLIDTYGNLKLLNSQLQVIWENRHQLFRGWFLKSDNNQIYVGHSQGINCYDITKGKILWEIPLNSSVLWGDLLDDYIIIGTSEGQIYQIKKQGDWKTKETKIKPLCHCSSASYCGIITHDQKIIITSDYQGYIYGFTRQGQLNWKHQIKEGTILELKTWQNLLFAVTTEGTIFAVNIDEITPTETSNLSPETSVNKGIILECYQQGKELKVRVVSPGYNPDWKVQFPKKLRQKSARYQVSSITEAKQGGFYRVSGEIKILS
jgi:outer membrane protein assembly factor BamB